MMDRILLLIDDEENILRALKRLLRRDGYTILTANSGQQGLELLKSHNVGVIISDQRMPEMSGVEFLSQVKNLYPDNVRMVLSGYTDLNSVTDAINEGAIYKFLTKPWDDDLLRSNVRQAFEHYELKSENIRLTVELKKANHELLRINAELEKSVKQKTRFVDINLQTLQVAQDVLEHLPVGVLGIDGVGMIAISNFQAHQLLWPESGYMVGSIADQVLPPAIAQCYQEYQNNEVQISQRIKLTEELTVEVAISSIGQGSKVQGAIIALTPIIGDVL